MRKPKNLPGQITNVVFTPTLLAYFWVVVKYTTSGLILYLVFMAVAYKMHLFEHLRTWPRISKLALICGPVLIATGVYCSAQAMTYWMIIPGIAYMALCMFGWRALVGKFGK